MARSSTSSAREPGDTERIVKRLAGGANVEASERHQDCVASGAEARRLRGSLLGLETSTFEALRRSGLSPSSRPRSMT